MSLKIKYNFFFLLLQPSAAIKILYAVGHDRRTTQLYDKVWVEVEIRVSTSVPLCSAYLPSFSCTASHSLHFIGDHPQFLSSRRSQRTLLCWTPVRCSVVEMPTFEMLHLSLVTGEGCILQSILCCRTQQFPESATITEYIQQVACSKFPRLKRWVPKKQSSWD